MIEYDTFHKPRKVKNANLKPINYTPIVKEKKEQWEYFIQATTQVVILISDQTSVEKAREIAVEWYKSCIKLGKEYYHINETTDQIFNNLAMLEQDVSTANFLGIERTFITTFTNVARYQKER